MKSFDSWGIRRRISPEHNYNAIWKNLKTVRLGEGYAKELPPEYSEFYDVGINTACNAQCPFCYVSAKRKGRNFDSICETWKKWMDGYFEKEKDYAVFTNKPFQIAIGSTGEPTIHPYFCEFLETIYNTHVVPNYTTNGIVLSDFDKPESRYYELANKILDYTRKYVGGVAVSFANESIRDKAENAVYALLAKGECKVNIHHIIYDKESVDDFVRVWREWGDKIAYHVLLPLMESGRSKKSMKPEAFEYLEKVIEENKIGNVAFGAHFAKYLKTSSIKTWYYPPESLSKNVILEKDCVKITPSSFDLTPIKTIDL